MILSVVIPTCKRPKVIQRAVKSVLNQDISDTEIIVVDDNLSADHELFKLGSLSGNISIVRNTGEHGAANARNVGIEAASGDWVAFLDDDDEYLPGYLGRVKESILNDIEASFYWCGVKVRFVGEEGEIKTSLIEPYKVDHAIFIGASYGVVIRKSILLESGGFNTDFRVAEDTELFTRLVANNIKVKPIDTLGILKHETHLDRLSGSLLHYSTDRVYEKIFYLYLPYFIMHKNNYMHMISWCSLIHVRYKNYNFALSNLKKLLTIGRVIRAAHLFLFLALHYFGVGPRAFLGYQIDMK